MTKILERDFVEDDAVVPEVPELERLRLQNLVLQQQLSRERLNVLTLQLLQSPEPRALRDRIEELTQQTSDLGHRLFAEAGLDPRLFELNVESGTFSQRSRNERQPAKSAQEPSVGHD